MKLQRRRNCNKWDLSNLTTANFCLFQVEALESETACRLKEWDRTRVQQLKEKEEEEDQKAWDKMYKIQVKSIQNAMITQHMLD